MLTLVRDGVDEPIKMELTRDVVAMRAVRWTMEGDVGDAAALSCFSEQAYVGHPEGHRRTCYKESGQGP